MGIPVGLVVFPVLVELNKDYPFREVEELILRFGRENGLPAHDLLPAFLGQNAPDLWVSHFDQHPNEKGHLLAADSMFPFIKQLLETEFHVDETLLEDESDLAKPAVHLPANIPE